jgi:hypothetical protein
MTARANDPFRKHWWVVLIVCAFVGFWIYFPSTSGTGSDAVDLDKTFGQTEQSLYSLDPAENPQGAPGRVLAVPVEGADGAYGRAASRAGQDSSLYQASGGASGEPISAEALASPSAQAKPAKDDGWGGQEPRTGFSRPQAKFDPAGSLHDGGGVSSSAQLVHQKPFGTGGDPGLDLRTGPGLHAAAQDARRKLQESVAESRTVQGLKQAEKASLAAIKGNDELASGMGGSPFDAGGGARSSMEALEAAAAGTGLGEGQGTPMNLKSSDPNVNQKVLEPPPIKDAGEVKDDSNKEYLQQQMLMMIMGVAISGILGPTFSGIGMALVGGMGLNQPSSQKALNEVDPKQVKKPAG